MGTFLGLSPWTLPLILAVVAGALLSNGEYAGAAVLAAIAIGIRWLHQIALDRGDYDD